MRIILCRGFSNFLRDKDKGRGNDGVFDVIEGEEAEVHVMVNLEIGDDYLECPVVILNLILNLKNLMLLIQHLLQLDGKARYLLGLITLITPLLEEG